MMMIKIMMMMITIMMMMITIIMMMMIKIVLHYLEFPEPGRWRNQMLHLLTCITKAKLSAGDSGLLRRVPIRTDGAPHVVPANFQSSGQWTSY